MKRRMLAKPAANAIADIGIAVRPRERFSALVGLVVGINQVTFAFGPSLVGVLSDAAGTYGLALGACVALQAAAAVMVLLGPRAGVVSTASERSSARARRPR